MSTLQQDGGTDVGIDNTIVFQKAAAGLYVPRSEASDVQG
jgi:hypothetical protein